MTDDAYDLVQELGAWAVDYLADRRPTSVRTKRDPADLVTETDEAVERHVRAEISKRFPSHRIVGEEYGTTGADDAPTWYLDPVDGTTNFVNGVPWFSFSLSLADAPTGPDCVVAGVVADPSRGEVFTAQRGRGAFVNGTPVKVSAATTLTGGVVLTEWSASKPWPGMSAFVEQLSSRHCTMRIMGSSALTLASIAADRGTAAVKGSFHPIDDLAGAFIASEAGAITLDEAGTRTLLPERGGLLVAAPGVAQDAWHAWTDGLGGSS
ncbi:inositol monophosphatase family protein [Tenggerimyces flavus]|uniref:Inositol monophosphatase family protein n=1 Tax=Tenggerimyces flavus TaxID=1708749 RepID=A0ABV7YFF4_9ACTN|nr:inositol monophosphatase family protein [Tenggerimyces flavus]MBM7786736.1 myo-inositol-1(or 4)-monophosphatase/deoxyribonuclease-2 [Tenggerimyces flavus]